MRQDKASRYATYDRYAFLIGLVIGLVAFVLIYGVNVINPINTEWLLHSDDLEGSIDLTQHYMGWVYYRDTPWSFPIGLTEGIYDNPVSVVYTDSIPLLAVIFKIFSGILPDSFQYMGLFGLMCYGLMGGFGALITRRFSSNVIVNSISAAFFVLSPVLLNRMYLHTALSAHFLIVAGIVLWLYRDRMTRLRYILRWTWLIVGGTLINAYFTPMLLGILLCAIVQNIITGAKIKHQIMLILTPLAATFLGAWLIGMFYGDNNASGSGGLDILSFNLDGFFNPMTYATDFGHFTHDFREISYSGIMRSFPLVTPYQNEGFAYLGLGMIILVIIAVVLFIAFIIRRLLSGRHVNNTANVHPVAGSARQRRVTVSYIVALLIYFGVFTLLALSPTWTIGGREILSIPWPEVIWNILSIFRSTGRFIWPVYYMIMSLALIVPAYIFARKRKVTYASKLFPTKNVFATEKYTVIIIMLLCLVAQIIDLMPAMQAKHYDFTKEIAYESDLKSVAWDDIAIACDKIVVYPPSQDLYWDGISALTFEIYAHDNDMKMNMTYMSRDLTEMADERTREEFADRAAGKTITDHAYIFLSAKPENLPDENKYNLNYYLIDGYIVGLDKSVRIR